MNKSDYMKYLASRDWALLKEKVKARSGGTCERCKSGPHEATHHITYERIGHEDLSDLLGVCGPCHEFLSGKTDVDPGAGPDLKEKIERYFGTQQFAVTVVCSQCGSLCVDQNDLHHLACYDCGNVGIWDACKFGILRADSRDVDLAHALFRGKKS